MIKIDKEKWYNKQDILKNKMFPWLLARTAVERVIRNDLKGHNRLKAIVAGKGTATKYYFKGSNIIKFVNDVEAGKIRL